MQLCLEDYFGINYNTELEMYRKGTVIYRAYDTGNDGEIANGESAGEKLALPSTKTQLEKERKKKLKAMIAVEHVDIIGDGFWDARPYILAPGKGDRSGGE